MGRFTQLTTHALLALAEAGLISLLVVALVAGTAFAAKGGGRTGGTLALAIVTDGNGNGLPNYGDVVTFSGSTTASDKPMVGLRCWQGSTWVFDGYVALFDSWLSKNLTLVSTNWDESADADCTARLFYYDNRSRERVLTTMGFGVAP